VSVGTRWSTSPIAILPDDPATLRKEPLRLIFHLTARLLPVPVHVTQRVMLLLILFLVLLFDSPTCRTAPILRLLLSTSNSCLFLFPQRRDYYVIEGLSLLLRVL
jgi:hypothetical protein